MAPSVAEISPFPSTTETKTVITSKVTTLSEEPSAPITTRAVLENNIRSKDLIPLWAIGANVTLPEPRTKHIPALWRYEETKDLLLKAGELVPAAESERRALIMINPGPQKPPHTLDTILSAHQLLLPGEKALCHRHTPFAVRFLIEGEKGFTAIAGKKMYMQPGDLIITPQWQWHDHGNEGTENVIWLDGLNIPFFSLNPVDFLEVYEDTYGEFTHESKVVTDEECKEMKFPWTVTKAALDASNEDHSVYDYLLPDSKPVNSIMSAAAERISPGKKTVVRQDTANRIYQVHSGRGKAVITAPRGGATYELTFGYADTFAVPSWYEFTIEAEGDEAAYLFTFSDKALLDNLGIYRSRA